MGSMSKMQSSMKDWLRPKSPAQLRTEAKRKHGAAFFAMLEAEDRLAAALKLEAETLPAAHTARLHDKERKEQRAATLAASNAPGAVVIELDHVSLRSRADRQAETLAQVQGRAVDWCPID